MLLTERKTRRHGRAGNYAPIIAVARKIPRERLSGEPEAPYVVRPGASQSGEDG